MSKKFFSFFSLSVGLVIMVVLLVACSDSNTPISPTATPNLATATPAPTPTPKPLVQPKIVRSLPDARGTVDFTELPDLKDGWPTLIWLDSANSIFDTKMQPIIDQLKATYLTRVKFTNLDYYDAANKPLIERYHITSQPAFILFDRNGQAIRSWIGIVSSQELEDNLKSVVGQ